MHFRRGNIFRPGDEKRLEQIIGKAGGQRIDDVDNAQDGKKPLVRV